MTTQILISPETQEELNHERFHYPHPLVQRRMEVLWLKSHGWAHDQIATLAGITENTVRDYFELYEADGIEGLKTVRIVHAASAMMAHYKSLEAYFQANPPATVKEAQHRIAELTGIQRSETQVRVFLKKTQIALSQGGHAAGESRSRQTSRLSQERT